MKYGVKLTTTAQKERTRLDIETRKRVDPVLLSLSEQPRPPGVQKLSGSKSDFRLRVGNYRVLYEVDDDQKVVLVWRIAHRREVYR